MKSGKLIFKKDVTMAEVVFPQDWIQQPYVFRLDCIRDWIYDLQKEFDFIVEFQEKERAFVKSVHKRMQQTAKKIENEIVDAMYKKNTEQEDEQ
jgi:hypothetical protein